MRKLASARGRVTSYGVTAPAKGSKPYTVISVEDFRYGDATDDIHVEGAHHEFLGRDVVVSVEVDDE